MAGISNWFEFQWPVKGEFSGFVRGRALPNFGIWNDFSPFTICKSMKGDEQFRPNPSISTPTNPNSKWIIPIPSTNRNDNSQNEIAELNRLKKDNIKEELERRSLLYDEKENRQELIAILRENIACETINKIAGNKLLFFFCKLTCNKIQLITFLLHRGKKGNWYSGK